MVCMGRLRIIQTDNTSNPRVTKCAQSDKCPFFLPISPLNNTTTSMVNSSHPGSKPPV